MRTVPLLPSSQSKRSLAAAFAMTIAVATAAPAVAENRVALVIGNASYHGPGLPNLPNTLKDADGITAALKDAGFQVVEVRNASKTEFRSALARFSALVKPGDTALFYFAGHGLQAAGATPSQHDNYLIPVDAQITAKEAVPSQTVSLTELFDGLEASQAGVRLMILDACRTELPGGAWKGEGAGLAWPAAANSRGVFIAFAAAPGQPAKEAPDDAHGYFTGALLKQLKVSQGWSVSEIFSEVSNAVEAASDAKQSPWFTGTGKAATLRLIPGERGEDAGEHELALYRDAVNCTQALCFEAASARISTPRLKQDLAARAAKLAPVAEAAPPVKSSSVKGQAKPHRLELLEPLPGTEARTAFYIYQHRSTARGERDIGVRFLTGAEGFPRSYPEASRWLTAAADGGNADAAQQLGQALDTGIGAPKDPVKALAAYERGGELGSVTAQYYAGMNYAVGEDRVPRRSEKAVIWLTRAAEGGSTEAMYSLAWVYIGGQVAPVDNALALRLLNKASGLGNAEATAQLGECYLIAQCGVDQDYGRGLEFSKKAAAAGSGRGAYNLASAYVDGKGVPADPKQGAVWLERSATLGYAKAIANLGGWYLKPTMPGGRDYDKAYLWFRRGADVGDAQSMYGLARCYEEGWGVVINWDETLKWLRLSAAAGYAPAIKALPVFIANHPGIDESPKT